MNPEVLKLESALAEKTRQALALEEKVDMLEGTINQMEGGGNRSSLDNSGICSKKAAAFINESYESNYMAEEGNMSLDDLQPGFSRENSGMFEFAEQQPKVDKTKELKKALATKTAQNSKLRKELIELQQKYSDLLNEKAEIQDMLV